MSPAALAGAAAALALAALWVLLRVLRARAWTRAHAALRASYDRPFARDFDVLVWRPGQEENDAAGVGFLETGAGGIKLAVYLLNFLGFPRKVQPTLLLLHPPECAVEGLVRVGGRWRVRISRGAERFVVADAASGSAESAHELRVAIDESFGGKPDLDVWSSGRIEGWRRVVLFATVAVGLGAAACAALALRGSPVPWTAPAGLGALAVAGVAVLVVRRQRRGIVTFYADSIVVLRDDEKSFEWSGVSAYDDSDWDEVQLLDELGRAPPDLAVATPVAADREALLALLERRGVKRAGS